MTSSPIGLALSICLGLTGAAQALEPVPRDLPANPIVRVQDYLPADICTRRGRRNAVFLPDHPLADRFGCVSIGALNNQGDQEEDTSPPVRNIAVFSGHGVTTSQCNGTMKGGLCSGSLSVYVRFPIPFDTVPHVLVSAEKVSGIGGCVGFATDTLVAFPDDVTEEGFRLYAWGSPVGESCGAQYSGWTVPATAGWLAIGGKRRP